MPGSDLLVGESDEDLAGAVLRLWRSPSELESLASRGLATVADKYSFKHLREAIASALCGLPLS